MVWSDRQEGAAAKAEVPGPSFYRPGRGIEDRFRTGGCASAEAAVPRKARAEGPASFRATRNRNRWSPVLKAVVFVALAGTIVWAKARVTEALQNAAGLKLASVKVTGTRYLDPAEVLAAAELPMGENMYKLDLKGAEARVKDLGWVDRVYLERRLPRSLVVAVRERVPVALLDSLRLYGVDREGRVLPVSPSLAEEDLPLISGLDVPPDAVGTTRMADRLEPGLEFLAFLERMDPDMAHDVSEVDLGEKGTLRVTFLDGVEARFRRQVTETELKRMAAVLSDLGGKGRRVASMDFRYSDSVFVKVRE